MSFFFFDVKLGGVNRDVAGLECATLKDAVNVAKGIEHQIRSGARQVHPNVFITIVDENGYEVSRLLAATPCDAPPSAQPNRPLSLGKIVSSDLVSSITKPIKDAA